MADSIDYGDRMTFLLSKGGIPLMFLTLCTSCCQFRVNQSLDRGITLTVAENTFDVGENDCPHLILSVLNIGAAPQPYAADQIFTGEVIVFCAGRTYNLMHRDVWDALATTSFHERMEIMPPGSSRTLRVDLGTAFVTQDEWLSEKLKRTPVPFADRLAPCDTLTIYCKDVRRNLTSNAIRINMPKP